QGNVIAVQVGTPRPALIPCASGQPIPAPRCAAACGAGCRRGPWRPIEALQEVLEKLKTERLPSIEKKLGSVPSCDAGEPCAVRKGARIGRFCNCPRGTACNFYILKCL
uniref:Cocaine- and amphetamine-regulated transcript protein n=1 Tax=Chelydra serpentina TaxID=8475 RepID=A0A8C3S059_CHESE